MPRGNWYKRLDSATERTTVAWGRARYRLPMVFLTGSEAGAERVREQEHRRSFIPLFGSGDACCVECREVHAAWTIGEHLSSHDRGTAKPKGVKSRKTPD